VIASELGDKLPGARDNRDHSTPVASMPPRMRRTPLLACGWRSSTRTAGVVRPATRERGDSFFE
jgi:hypothetical protein